MFLIFHACIMIVMVIHRCLQCFDTVGWVAGRPVKIEWWGAGVVICLEQGADCLHMAQLIPLPLTVCVKSRLVYLSGTGSTGQKAAKRVCLCVCVWLFVRVHTLRQRARDLSASIQTELLDRLEARRLQRPQSTSSETAAVTDGVDASVSTQADVLPRIQQCLQAVQSIQVMILDLYVNNDCRST